MIEVEPKEGIINKTPENKEKKRHLIIGLHGTIGVGKTELAKLLKKELDLVHFQEKYGENPYLELFYDNPSAYSFLMESWFLEEKVKQMVEIDKEAKNGTVIVDPSLWQDTEIYAYVHRQLGWMTEEQYQDYLISCRGLVSRYHVCAPDLVISVHAPWETVRDRIRRRERKFEMLMLKRCPEYFQQIAQRTEEWAEENRTKVPIFTIDSGNLNYVENKSTQRLVINRIQLKATQIVESFPELDLSESLRYYWPNSDPTVYRRNRLRY